ncbi:MAG: CPBP family intramembrane glutamic endopeptidase [Actinomycetota bacterium]
MSTNAYPSARVTHAVILAFGLIALTFRGFSSASIVATALVGVASLTTPSNTTLRVSSKWMVVTAAGMGAFTLGRLVSGTPGFRPTLLGITALMVAAVCEEAFFRRFLYGLLEKRSVALAIAVSATLFALVHLPLYGVKAMPIDIAAGLLLSWQRWASGSWTSPMLTHMFVNLIQLG